MLAQLDLFRSAILKETFKFSFFRQIFLTRAYRLSVYFVFSFLLNLTLALNFPLWVLLLGPLILGVPHLLSSIRYLPKLTTLDLSFSSQKLYSIIGSVYVLIATLRVLGLAGALNYTEIITIAAMLFVLGFFSSFRNIRLLCAAGVLIALSLLSFYYPLETLGLLVLAHNFIAFFFWFMRAKDIKEKRVALISLFIFSVTTVALLTGWFDSLMQARSVEILNGWFAEINIGSQIFPHADAALIARAVAAYAFGQGLHYFVWLKAIPEQELKFQHNTSFKTTFNLLKSDISLKLIITATVLFLGIIVYGLFTNLMQARLIYLSLAALHGYLEIVALSFAKAKSS